jgi:hypothetical protein
MSPQQAKEKALGALVELLDSVNDQIKLDAATAIVNSPVPRQGE